MIYNNMNHIFCSIFFLHISNLDVTRNVSCEGFDWIYIISRVLFNHICLNSFPQKLCFPEVLARARPEYLEHRGFLLL